MVTSGDVFVVDDMRDNLEILALLLADHGHRIRTATSGAQALADLDAEPAELVLLDVSMPDVDGYEVCRRLKANPRTSSIPVIFLSGLGHTIDKVTAFQAGGIDYVTKPFQVEEVLARVDTHLQMYRLQRETAAKNEMLTRANEEIRRSEEELRRAHDQIARLESTSASAMLEDTPTWASHVAGEVARAIGAAAIGVWELDPELGFVPLAPGPTSPPDLAAFQSSARLEEFAALDGHGEKETVVPVVGLTGEPFGALVLHAPDVRWRMATRRVVLGFARHLGSALELRRTRAELLAAEAKGAISRRELHARGVATFDLCPSCGRCFARLSDETKETTCQYDGARLDSAYAIPVMIGERYRVERLLGEGGMGAVFAACDTRLSRDVALKIIKREHIGNTDVLFRLEREAKALASIRHPGVVVVHDSGELEDGAAYLVMELLEGRNLASVLSQFGRGSLQQVASLVRQLGAALASAHRAGVIHRDVKPENVILGRPENEAPGFVATILDFGIALGGTDARVTQAGIAIGTPAYMSPEQAQGENVDERSDLYSLAVVAYHALTGRIPIEVRRSPVETMRRVLTQHPPKPSSLLAGLTDEVDDLFEDALAKDRDNRPFDIGRWSEDLAAALTKARAPKGGWPDPLPPRRRPHLEPSPTSPTVT